MFSRENFNSNRNLKLLTIKIKKWVLKNNKLHLKTQNEYRENNEWCSDSKIIGRAKIAIKKKIIITTRISNN